MPGSWGRWSSSEALVTRAPFEAEGSSGRGLSATLGRRMRAAGGGQRLCPICGEQMEALICPSDGVQTVDVSVAKEASVLEPGEVVAERYRIERALGTGAMGTVYAATQLSMSRPVALKVMNRAAALDGTVLRRFFREARSASQLKHPNVVGIHDFGVDDLRKMPFLAMELIEGRTLRAIIEEEAPLSPLRAMALLEQVARALVAAHRAGIIHRDLKPDNVMVQVLPEGEEHVTVLDFGIAKVRSGRDSGDSLTASGIIIGTPRYMSPEQVEGRPAGPVSDLYSLGCILHEVLTGGPPFAGEGAVTMMLQHLRRDRPTLPADRPIPEGLRDLHRALLELSPEARPTSAAEVARRLKGLMAEAEVVLSAPPREPDEAPPEVAVDVEPGGISEKLADAAPGTLSGRPSSEVSAGSEVSAELSSDLLRPDDRGPGSVGPRRRRPERPERPERPDGPPRLVRRRSIKWMLLGACASLLVLAAKAVLRPAMEPARVSAETLAARPVAAPGSSEPDASDPDEPESRAALEGLKAAGAMPPSHGRPALSDGLNGGVRVSSIPPGASVWRGGVRLGFTPLDLESAEDLRHLRLRLDGFDEARVDLAAGATGPVEVRLIRSEPGDASGQPPEPPSSPRPIERPKRPPRMQLAPR